MDDCGCTHFGPPKPAGKVMLVTDKNIAMALVANYHDTYTTYINETTKNREWLFQYGIDEIVKDIKRYQLGDLKVQADRYSKVMSELEINGEHIGVF